VQVLYILKEKMGTNFDITQKISYFDRDDIRCFLNEVWKRIPENDQQTIWDNLVRIVFLRSSNYAGNTTLDEKTGLYVVSIRTTHPPEIIKYAIAHEFAHIVCQPKRDTEEDKEEECAEAKANEWGFIKPSGC
jgi:hypothetical protein